MKAPELTFDGPDYVHGRDAGRLAKQHETIRDLMLDGRPRTLGEIEALTGYPPASISAQLRHLRKERFGSHNIRKRHRGEPGAGLYEYWVDSSPIKVQSAAVDPSPATSPRLKLVGVLPPEPYRHAKDSERGTLYRGGAPVTGPRCACGTSNPCASGRHCVATGHVRCGCEVLS